MKFGLNVGVSATLNQANIRIAEIISGVLIGPIAVAFIRAGSRIVEILNQITYMPFHQIAMPIMARTADAPAVLKYNYLHISKFSSFLMFPTFIGVFSLSPQIILIIFGPGWEQVSTALRIFSCAVIASQTNNLTIAAITAIGKTRTILSWTITQIIFGLIATFAVHRWGWQAILVSGVARGYLTLPYSLYILYNYLNISLKDVVKSIKTSLISSFAMGTIVTFGSNMISLSAIPLFDLIIWIFIGIIIYLITYFLQEKSIFVIFFKYTFMNKNFQHLWRN